MPKKPKLASKNALQQFRKLSRKQLIISGLVFTALVGGIGAYTVSSSLAYSGKCNTHTYGVGNAGTCVRIIQSTVKRYGLSTGGSYFKYSSRSVLSSSSFADGIYGGNTRGQVENFQHWQYGLSVDGVVGPKTWGKLCSLPFAYITQSDRRYACGY